MIRILCFIFIAAACHAQVVITASTPVVVGAEQPGALKKAAADLASDLSKVFGQRVRVLNQAPAGKAALIRVGVERNGQAASEVLHIRASGNEVALTGSDLRGAIYAVYHFSQQFLAVDPLWYWTDHDPPRKARVAIPADTSITAGPPVMRYRGWFLNDEDLLTGWKPGTAQKTGISLAVWDKVFEAILRLKGNMVVPGTFVFPDEPQVRAAGERGLVITQHHIEVLGTNTYRWPDGTPYSFLSQPDAMLGAWRNSMKGYAAGQEVIWTLGYRGRHDRAFWTDDAAVGKTDAERAQAIQKAIGAQMEMLRGERAKPYFLMNAWMESVPFIRQGLLKIPDGVTVVWPDNGHGLIRDEGSIAKGQGVYYHTAMYNSRANQLTEMVPLDRIQRELGRAIRAGATEYLLINVSDVRPVPLTTRAAMQLAWDGKPLAPYLEKWCREEFGAKAVAPLMGYYRAYFAAPGRYGKEEQETLADNAYHTFARHILVSLITGKPDLPSRFPTKLNDFAALMQKAAAVAEPRWRAAREEANRIAPQIPQDRWQFFQFHVRTQLAIHEYSNRMLRMVAEIPATRKAEDKKRKLRLAILDLSNVLDSLKAAEYGKWKGFYDHEYFTNVRHTLALAQALAAQLDSKTLPPGVVIKVRPEDPYVWLKSYQGDRRLAVN